MIKLDLYLLLDSARVGSEINYVKKVSPDYKSLFLNQKTLEVIEVAPFLFKLHYQSQLLQEYFMNGLMKSIGIIVETHLSFEECWKHFRKFLIVKTEEGQELYFRFYDPRVLKIFLPTCDQSQILEFFGPVDSFIVEADNREEAIRFWHQNGELMQEIISAQNIFGSMSEAN